MREEGRFSPGVSSAGHGDHPRCSAASIKPPLSCCLTQKSPASLSTVRPLIKTPIEAAKWRRPRGGSQRLTDPQSSAGHSPLQNVTGLLHKPGMILFRCAALVLALRSLSSLPAGGKGQDTGGGGNDSGRLLWHGAKPQHGDGNYGQLSSYNEASLRLTWKLIF